MNKKKKAPGPDKIHNEMLLNLGPKGKEVHLALLKTWERGYIATPWKLDTINRFLKKGKVQNTLEVIDLLDHMCRETW